MTSFPGHPPLAPPSPPPLKEQKMKKKEKGCSVWMYACIRCSSSTFTRKFGSFNYVGVHVYVFVLAPRMVDMWSEGCLVLVGQGQSMQHALASSLDCEDVCYLFFLCISFFSYSSCAPLWQIGFGAQGARVFVFWRESWGGQMKLWRDLAPSQPPLPPPLPRQKHAWIVSYSSIRGGVPLCCIWGGVSITGEPDFVRRWRGLGEEGGE